MKNEKQEIDAAVRRPEPRYRAWLCGPFRLERRVGESYEAVERRAWGGHASPRTLLKALLCAPGRQMRRSTLAAQLWPEASEAQANREMSVALTLLRRVLRGNEEEKVLIEEGTMGIRLAGQAVFWVDADAASLLLTRVERIGEHSPEALPLLEEALSYFDRGAFLGDDEGEWVMARRALVERQHYRCRLRLADRYGQQGRVERAESVLNDLLRDDPFDEDVICRLMLLLHHQGLTHQAMRVYQQTSVLFAEEGMEFTEATREVAARLMQERHVPLMNSVASGGAQIVPLNGTTPDMTKVPDLSRRKILQQILLFTGTIAFPSDVVTSLSGLEHLSYEPSQLFNRADITPEKLQDFATLTEICRKLSEGNELQIAEKILWSYLPRIESLVTFSSKEPTTATARMLSEGYLLAASLVGHRNDLRSRYFYSEQALLYGEMAQDAILQVAAFRQLAATLNYLKRPSQVMETYQRALPLLSCVPPLLQSCIYAALSGIYAQFQQKQEADHYIGLAYERFGTHQGDEPDFLRSINASENLLIHWAGKNHLRLGRPKQAEAVFLKFDVLDPRLKLPKRIRIEAINNRARMFVAVEDMEQACLYLETALRYALEIGSSLRLNEVADTFQLMREKWPAEKKIHLLSDLFIQSLINSA